MRDYRKLRAFVCGDAVVVRIYPWVRRLPVHERYGLALQIRRAAVSVVANIEGSARSSGRRCVNTAISSTSQRDRPASSSTWFA
ncbi:MAG: four helix bundle protein [Acidobacteriota bacterium]